MKLYHISFDTDNLNKEFIPRVPEAISSAEDHTTPRICFTDSIEHCLQAMASEYRSKIERGCKIAVYSIDSNNIAPDKLVIPEKLVSQGLVPDALENQEYWVLEKVCLDRKVIQIVNFEYEHELAFTCIKSTDIHNIVKEILPGLDVSESKSSKEIYDAAMEYAHTHKLYDAEDEIWDTLVELPYAQKTSFSGIVLLKIA